MTDRELLELAAKAIGEQVVRHDEDGVLLYGIQDPWNPLISDAEAFRLMATLKMDVMFSPEDVEVIATQHADGDFVSPFALESWTLKPQDTYAATRLAIVRAAAEIERARHGCVKPRKGNKPIDELVQEYADECCDFSDLDYVRRVSLRYVSTMEDCQVRCLLYVLATLLHLPANTMLRPNFVGLTDITTAQTDSEEP